jgi:hypothetical protein
LLTLLKIKNHFVKQHFISVTGSSLSLRSAILSRVLYYSLIELTELYLLSILVDLLPSLCGRHDVDVDRQRAVGRVQLCHLKSAAEASKEIPSETGALVLGMFVY